MESRRALDTPNGYPALATAPADGNLLAAYQAVRRTTAALCEPLEIEDYLVQSMPDASPVKWHLAHTTWFFETFVLVQYLPDYRLFHPQFGFLFNSYYDAAGPRFSRSQRGLLTRPTLAEVNRFRTHVDEHMVQLLESAPDRSLDDIAATVTLGIHHEQQHQELILTDLKHAWAANPLRPVYHERVAQPGISPARDWLPFPEGIARIGHDGLCFALDNESPRQRVFLHPFQLASRLVTNGEYLQFMAEDGYNRPELWLSDGWAVRQARGWKAPLYWENNAGTWTAFTLSGQRPIDWAEPACHVSYYEADAFARWAGARLPTEAEWEFAAGTVPLAGHFLEGGQFHPAHTPAKGDNGRLIQLLGDVWQWTMSPYVGYPGYHPPTGALGEYNGKFMCNQLVLRGASCLTPRSHARQSYRNFFPPDARWQFSGVRLAKDFS